MSKLPKPQPPRPRLASIRNDVLKAYALLDDAMYPFDLNKKKKPYEISFDDLEKAETLLGRTADRLTEERERFTLAIEDYEFAISESEKDDG